MITSAHNPRIQTIRRLQNQSRKRMAAGKFVIEGVRLAEEAWQAGWKAEQVLFTEQLDERGRRVVEQFSSQGVLVDQVSEMVMRAISETEAPQGLLAVLAMQKVELPDTPDFLLVLDGVRDPGNLGTILRTCTAAKVQAALLAPGNADAWSPKVLRAGMGAHFRMPVQRMDWGEIRSILKGRKEKLMVYLADASAGIPYSQADFRGELAIIVGGEAAGAGAQSLALADERVHIPMPGGSESLNAAVAASILIFEVLRQRGS